MFRFDKFRNLNISFLHKSLFCTIESIVTPRVPHTKTELYQSLIMLKPNSPINSKSLKVSVLGCPNSGKSTLVNMLTRWKVCAVTGKINTTRTKQTVILTQDNTQLCFIDMPGVLGRKKGFNFKLEKSLIRDPHVGIFESDLIICVVDVAHKDSHEELNMELLKALHFFRDKPSILVLNKIDRMKKKMMLFDITKRLTDGVVGGKISHKDRYANRFRRDVPSYEELLADSRMDQLVEGRLGCQETLQIEDSINNSVQKLSISDIKVQNQPSIDYAATVDDSSNNYDQGVLVSSGAVQTQSTVDYSVDCDRSSRETEVQEELRNLLPGLVAKDDIIDRDGLEIDDQIMGVLRAQLAQLGGDHNEIVAKRRAEWRQVTARLDRTRETSWRGFQEVFAVSSATGHGIDRLREWLLSQARDRPWSYHSSLVTDTEPEQIVRTAVQAACLTRLHQEVPYRLQVEVDSMETAADGSVHLLVTLLCPRSRHLTCGGEDDGDRDEGGEHPGNRGRKQGRPGGGLPIGGLPKGGREAGRNAPGDSACYPCRSIIR